MSTRTLTDLDIATGIEEHVIRFDVAMYDVLAVEVGKTFASLQEDQHSSRCYCDCRRPTSLQMVDICASVI